MKQIPLPPETIVDLPHPDDGTHVIAPDLAYRRLALVNVVFLGRPGAGDRQWTLIDAGVPGLGGLIESASSERFGQEKESIPGPRPALAAPSSFICQLTSAPAATWESRRSKNYYGVMVN